MPWVMLRPRWLLVHLGVVGGLWMCYVLAGWQWSRGASASGSFRNYFYAVQWIIFGAIAVYGYVRAAWDAIHPERRRPPGHKSPARADHYVDQPVIDDSDDPELAAYNAMLARKARGTQSSGAL